MHLKVYVALPAAQEPLAVIFTGVPSSISQATQGEIGPSIEPDTLSHVSNVGAAWKPAHTTHHRTAKSEG